MLFEDEPLFGDGNDESLGSFPTFASLFFRLCGAARARFRNYSFLRSVVEAPACMEGPLRHERAFCY